MADHDELSTKDSWTTARVVAGSPSPRDSPAVAPLAKEGEEKLMEQLQENPAETVAVDLGGAPSNAKSKENDGIEIMCPLLIKSNI